MKKVLFLLFLVPIVGFSQNKKEQIITLNFKLDSLINKISNERQASKKEIVENEKKISSLNTQINRLNFKNDNLSVKLNELKSQGIKNESDIRVLKYKIDSLYSAIKILDAINKDYRYLHEESEFNGMTGNIIYFENFSNNYSVVKSGNKFFLKFKKYPIPNKGTDILNWLKQFEVQNVTSIVYDYDVDPEDWKGVLSYTIKTYKNGISVHELGSYGGISIKIDIPFLSIDDAKVIFSKLSLWNMAEGCLDEFDLKYEYDNSTLITSIYFGNGC